MGASARQPSVAGSYSHASLTGFQPGGPDAGRWKPPNKYIFPFSAVTAAWWTGCGIGFFSVHASLAGSYSYTRPAGLNPGRSPWAAQSLPLIATPSSSPAPLGNAASLLDVPR